MSANSTLKGLTAAQWKGLNQLKEFVMKSLEGKLVSMDTVRLGRDWYVTTLKSLSTGTAGSDQADKVKSDETAPENKKEDANSRESEKPTMTVISIPIVDESKVDKSVGVSVQEVEGQEKAAESGGFLTPYLIGLKLLGRQNGEEPVPKWKVKTEEKFSKASVDARTRYVVSSIQEAKTSAGMLVKLEEFCRHLDRFPQAKGLAVKHGAIRYLLQMRDRTSDTCVLLSLREALALLGYIDPVKGRGIRILSIDGGGTRGLMVIEILKRFEKITGRKVHELFDYICGVSTGAILAVLLGLHKKTLAEAEDLYRNMSTTVFKQSAFWGTSSLVWSHSYYDTAAWEKFLRTLVGEMPMIKLSRDPDCPKVSSVSTVVNQHNIFPYVFRTYNLPYRTQSQYVGSSSHLTWEAVRASAAAPSYFEGLQLGEYLHQDGGVLVNNPCALAIHEAKLLWPQVPLQCVISMGTGHYQPTSFQSENTTLSWKSQFYKIMDSATDTEAVHISLNDLLPANIYHRFNPKLTDLLTLDEIRPEKMEQMQEDARMYCRRNRGKLEHACALLVEPKTSLQKAKEWLDLRRARLV